MRWKHDIGGWKVQSNSRAGWSLISTTVLYLTNSFLNASSLDSAYKLTSKSNQLSLFCAEIRLKWNEIKGHSEDKDEKLKLSTFQNSPHDKFSKLWCCTLGALRPNLLEKIAQSENVSSNQLFDSFSFASSIKACHHWNRASSIIDLHARHSGWRNKCIFELKNNSGYFFTFLLKIKVGCAARNEFDSSLLDRCHTEPQHFETGWLIGCLWHHLPASFTPWYPFTARWMKFLYYGHSNWLAKKSCLHSLPFEHSNLPKHQILPDDNSVARQLQIQRLAVDSHLQLNPYLDWGEFPAIFQR